MVVFKNSSILFLVSSKHLKTIQNSNKGFFEFSRQKWKHSNIGNETFSSNFQTVWHARAIRKIGFLLILGNFVFRSFYTCDATTTSAWQMSTYKIPLHNDIDNNDEQYLIFSSKVCLW